MERKPFTFADPADLSQRSGQEPWPMSAGWAMKPYVPTGYVPIQPAPDLLELSKMSPKVDEILASGELASGGYGSLSQQIMRDFHEKISQEWNQRLKDYLKANLAALGFTFDDEQSFIDFALARIRRMDFPDRLDEHEFYLDYVDEQNPGKLVGYCSKKIRMTCDGDTIKATIG